MLVIGVAGVLTTVGVASGSLAWPEGVVIAACLGLLAFLVAS